MSELKKYPTDAEARKMIVEIGRRMYMKNFVAANDGNISCKVDDDTIWTTPTGVSKGFMSEDEMVKMRLDGTVPCVHYEAPGSQGIPDSIAPYVRDYNALLLANHGAVAWGSSLMEAWYRLEATEHYAMVIMYTGNIIGKANVLSCDQVGELIRIREKMGITTGGIPACAARPSNTVDVVAGHSPVGEQPDGLKTYGQNGTGSPCGCASGSDSLSEAELKQITQAVIARLSGRQ